MAIINTLKSYIIFLKCIMVLIRRNFTPYPGVVLAERFSITIQYTSMNRRNGLLLLFVILVAMGARGQAKRPDRKIPVSKNAGITVATYNIRYANRADSINGNGWLQRLPVIAQLIKFYDFDIFGTQEALYQQVEGLKDSLRGYAYTGVGRDDGQQAGEYSAIFYKTAKFRLLDKGNFWLSPITDKPNKGWDAALPRICSWGKFKVVETGFEFYLFNLHMDHIGIQARAESAKLVLSKIAGFPSAMPVILTGDFNVDQNNESYSLINNSGVLKDSYDKADEKYALNGTFNNFRADSKTDSRIDHIFVGPAFKVLRYGILTDSYRLKTAADAAVSVTEKPVALYTARMPSDHFPVMVKLEYRR
jgi:endonuclease/exonuclease/phosphatase family metal-dependent hydrolase